MHGKEPNTSTYPKTVRFGGKVAEILQQCEEGNRKDYDLLIHQIADPEIKSPSLLCWIQELRQDVTQFGKDYEVLINTILKIEWQHHTEEVIHEYQALLVDLVSAQTVYLKSVLKMLIKKFVLNAEPKLQSEEELMRRREREALSFKHVHTALQIIIKIVPMTPQYVMPVLSDCFPFMRKDVHIQECYVKNLLILTQYIPHLRQKILELIVEKMIQIDVHAPRADIEAAEEAAGSDGDMEDVMFEMDAVVEEKNDDEKDTIGMEDEKKEDITPSGPMKHPLANTLDILMNIILEYICNTCHPNGEFDLNSTKDLFRSLLAIFERVILPTHACCHVQFMMFYICSFSQALVDFFLDYLWKMIESPNTPAIVRQAAASYVASFLSRSKFVPLSAVRASLDVMISWVHRYIDCQNGSTRSYADINLHGPFYSVCQAIFYTFVFRHKHIVAGSRGLMYARNLNLERIITSRLNPLKVCLPTVVNMFATITRNYEIALCYTIIERNNRAIIPVVSQSRFGTSSKLTNMNPLDSFFPFDPYFLHKSVALIEPLYQQWEGKQPEDEQSSSGEDEEEEEYSLYQEKEILLPLGITPTSAMCVSPGFRSASFGT